MGHVGYFINVPPVYVWLRRYSWSSERTGSHITLSVLNNFAKEPITKVGWS